MSAVLRAVPAVFDPAELTFDEEAHKYVYRGKVLPSVTQLLSGLHSFAGVSHEVLEAARERGTHVHSATHYFDEGDLDISSLDEQTRGYLKAWSRFTLDTDPEWTAIEVPIAHPVLLYAGTPDRRGDITLRGERVADCQVDIKTAVDSHPVWGVQTIAYDKAAGKEGRRRFTCQLRADGTYRLLEWASPQDWPVFMSLLTLRTWKERNAL